LFSMGLRSGCCPRAARSDLARRSSRWCTNRLQESGLETAQGGRLSRERARRAGRCCARRGHERGLIADYSIQSRRISVCDQSLGRANRSYHDISNTWFGHGFLSSSPTCPATQSVSRKCASRNRMHRVALDYDVSGPHSQRLRDRSSLDHRRSDVPTAENGFATPYSVNKSAKVVLAS
jgi:hypothetical protein